GRAGLGGGGEGRVTDREEEAGPLVRSDRAAEQQLAAADQAAIPDVAGELDDRIERILERLPLVEEPRAALDRQRKPGPRRENSVDARQVADRLASRVRVLGNGEAGVAAIATERVGGEGGGPAGVGPA